MITKGLFDVNMKCLFWGEFGWVIMMLKIRIIIMLLFLESFFIYKDCVVKGYMYSIYG